MKKPKNKFNNLFKLIAGNEYFEGEENTIKKIFAENVKILNQSKNIST